MVNAVLRRFIKKIKFHSYDFVLVIVHSGHEQYEYPSPRMVDTYRFFADLGVTEIIGHHPHCASGYEIYNNVPIFYSIGNFILIGKTEKIQWYKGYSVKLSISKDSVDNFSLIPYKQYIT